MNEEKKRNKNVISITILRMLFLTKYARFQAKLKVNFKMIACKLTGI